MTLTPSSSLGTLPLLVLLLWSTGCVHIALGEGVVMREEPLENRQAEVLSKRVRVNVEQEDTRLRITAERACDLEDRARVRQTLEHERVNSSPGVTWQLGIYGAILAAVGTGVIIDAQLNVEDSDLDGQNYNPIGPTAATVIGAAFLAAASPMLIIAVVDGLRSTGTEEEVVEVESSRGIVARDTPCEKRVPVHGAVVLGRTSGGTQMSLGSTDPDGVLEVELADAVSPDVTLGERAVSLAIYMDENHIGVADLKPVAAVHQGAAAEGEDKDWASLDVTACEEEGSPSACQSIEKFLEKHPDGEHAPAARAALQKGKAKIAARDAVSKQKQDQAAAAAAAAAEAKRKKEEAARVCRQKCSLGCKGNAECTQACVAAKCP